MIELNGIQISDNNINTKKNVKIYVDEKQLGSKVGELSDLKTTDKSSIVNAINEVKDTTNTLQVDVNRIYSDFTIIPNTPTEQEFTYKQSNEGVIEKGVAVIDKVKGNSVVWNQLIKDFREPSNWLTNNCDVTVVGDKIHIKFTSASSSSSFGVKSSAFSAGHKYCVLMNNENAIPLTAIKLGSESGVGTSGSTLNLNPPAITIAIPKGSADAGALWFWPSNETKLEGDFSNIYVIDLTQMFGAGNEPTTVEEFLSRKPKMADEYAYNEGTIVNNKVETIKAQGRNLATSDILLSTNFGSAKFANAFLHRGTYCISLDTPQAITLYVALFDKNGNNISSSASSLGEGWALNSSMVWWYHTIDSGGKLSFSLAKDAIVSIKTNVTLSQTTHIMLNMGTTSLPYEPYEEHTLDLSWIKEIKDGDGVKLFEDGMKSAGTAFDEVRKNKAVKRIGVKVFDGTENVAYADTSVQNNKTCITYFDKERIIFPNRTDNPNPHICNKFTYLGNVASKSIALGNNVVGSYGYSSNGNTAHYYMYFVVDGIMTIDSWKAHLAELYAAGTPLVVYYELAEPIEVEYDEKSLTYPVIAGGTEEAIVSEPSTPMRASITYGSNTVATILSLMNRVNELERKIIN